MHPRAQIPRILRSAENDQNPNIQPSILLNVNIDPTQVVECISCEINGLGTDKIKTRVGQGFTIFRIQTEFGINGHITMAYLAKLNPATLLSLTELNLGSRIEGLLNDAGIKTLAQLLQTTLFDLKKIRKLGKKGLQDILDALSAKNLKLKG